MLEHGGLQGPQEPSAEGRGDLSSHAAMFDRILFPDKATEIFTAVLEVSFDEDFQVLVLWRVDVGECLGREEGELIRCDPHY